MVARRQVGVKHRGAILRRPYDPAGRDRLLADFRQQREAAFRREHRVADSVNLTRPLPPPEQPPSARDLIDAEYQQLFARYQQEHREELERLEQSLDTTLADALGEHLVALDLPGSDWFSLAEAVDAAPPSPLATSPPAAPTTPAPFARVEYTMRRAMIASLLEVSRDRFSSVHPYLVVLHWTLLLLLWCDYTACRLRASLSWDTAIVTLRLALVGSSAVYFFVQQKPHTPVSPADAEIAVQDE
jgi:hypothetical protein